jgi:hypothetical protein
MSDAATPVFDPAKPFTRGVPAQAFDTRLAPAEESAFTAWKQQYAPKDSGADYDLRGAFKAGLTPDPTSGHWPDTYKKPNHPTFSDQSIYAKGREAQAGRWEGEKFIPPQQSAEPKFDPSKPFTRGASAHPPNETGETSTLGALWSGLAHGAGNIVHGAARIGARMSQEGQESPIPEVIERVDKTALDRQKAFERQPSTRQHPTATAIGEVGGEMGATAPLAAGAGAGGSTALRGLWGMLSGGAGGALGGAAEAPAGDKFGPAVARSALTGAGVGGALGAGGAMVRPSVLERPRQQPAPIPQPQASPPSPVAPPDGMRQLPAPNYVPGAGRPWTSTGEGMIPGQPGFTMQRGGQPQPYRPLETPPNQPAQPTRLALPPPSVGVPSRPGSNVPGATMRDTPSAETSTPLPRRIGFPEYQPGTPPRTPAAEVIPPQRPGAAPPPPPRPVPAPRPPPTPEPRSWTEAARMLTQNDVRLSPGQARNMSEMERNLQSWPILRGFVKGQVGRSVDDFQRSAVAQALAPIGAIVPRTVKAGHALMDFATDKLGQAYERILPKLSLAKEGVARVIQADPEVSMLMRQMAPDDAKSLANVIQDRVLARFDDNGMMDGRTFKAVESRLSRLADSLSQGRPELSYGIRHALGSLRDELANQNPIVGPDLQKINDAFSMFARLRAASVRDADSRGRFEPHDLLQAMKSEDPSSGNSSFSRGRAPMQAFAEAGNEVIGPSLTNRVPEMSRSAVRVGADAMAGAAATLPYLGAAGAQSIPGLGRGIGALAPGAGAEAGRRRGREWVNPYTVDPPPGPR